MKFNAAVGLTFFLSSLAIAAETSEGQPVAQGKRVGAVASVEMAVRSDEYSKLLAKRRKHHNNIDVEMEEEEDEGEEDEEE